MRLSALLANVFVHNLDFTVTSTDDFRLGFLASAGNHVLMAIIADESLTGAEFRGRGQIGAPSQPFIHSTEFIPFASGSMNSVPERPVLSLSARSLARAAIGSR